MTFIETFDPADSRETKIGKRRKALNVDLFLTWSIIEKSFPPKRIKIILIDEEMGL
jgi:hypothetical protein